VTKEVYELVNRQGEIFLTSSVIAGNYAIRVVSANPKAEEKYSESLSDSGGGSGECFEQNRRFETYGKWHC
jgi:hypothetical protein